MQSVFFSLMHFIFIWISFFLLGCLPGKFQSNPELNSQSLEATPFITQTVASGFEQSNPYAMEYGGACTDGLLVLISGGINDTTNCVDGEWTYYALSPQSGTLNLIFSQSNTFQNAFVSATWEVLPLEDRVYVGTGISEYSTSYDPVNDPSYSSNAIKILAEGPSFCALLSNGKVICWGEAWSGYGLAPYVPTSLPTTGFVDITAHWRGYTGVRSNGDIWFWTLSPTSPSLQVNISGATKLMTAYDGFSFCVLTNMQAVLCSGENSAGELGDGTTVDRNGTSTQPLGLASNVLQISGSEGDGNLFCALKVGGLLYCWGELDGNSVGATPTLVLSDANIVEISTVGTSICIRRNDNTVACRGSIYGDALNFIEIADLPSSIDKIEYCSNAIHCIYDDQGRVWELSSATATSLGPFTANVSSRKYDWGAKCFIHRGQVKCMGENTSNFTLGFSNGVTYVADEASAISFDFSKNIRQIVANPSRDGGCVVDIDNDLSCWGKYIPDMLSLKISAGSTPRVVLSQVTDIVKDPYEMTKFRVLQNGAVLEGDSNGFTVVPWLTSGVQKATNGYPSNCALFTDGSVKCADGYQESNVGVAACDSGDCSTPHTPVGMTSGVTDIASGYDIHCAIKTGELWCWGYLGSWENTPRKVTALPSDLTKIYISYQDICAYSTASGLVCTTSWSGAADTVASSLGMNVSTGVYEDYTVRFMNAGVSYTWNSWDGLSIDSGAPWELYMFYEGGWGQESHCKVNGSNLKCWNHLSWMPGLDITPYLRALDPIPAHLTD